MVDVIKRELKIQLLSLKGSQFILLLLSMAVVVMMLGKNFISFIIIAFTIRGLEYTGLENRDGVYKSTLSYPCTRKDYVLGKFISSILVIIIGGIVSLTLNKILLITIPTKFQGVNMYSLNCLLLYSLLTVSIYYFAYFSLGIKVARISFIIGFVFISDIFKFKSELISNPSIQFNVILIIGVLVITAILDILSVVIYEKKDL